MNSNNFMSVIDGPGQFQIHATGPWTAPNANQLENLLLELENQVKNAAVIQLDLSAVTEFDTFGAWLVERFCRDLASQERPIKVSGLMDHSLPLFKEMEAVNQTVTSKTISPPAFGFWTPVFARTVVDFWHQVITFIVVFGAIVNVVGRVIVRPRIFRLTSTIHQFDRVGWKALPIVLLITFIIGAIIAQQGFFHFSKFGAAPYVVDMVGFLTMRELGVLLVAIVIAGRTASSYTAELGTMKMREELDALKTMGYDPVEILILPRILVLVIALPILTFIGSMAALSGAALVAIFYADINPEFYIDRLKVAISVDHFLVGMIKAPFMGIVIGVIACTEGLQVKGSATSLGIHTTRSVVKSIFMVIFLDGLFAMFFSAIGM
ncbi:MAG: ABC transporter permease [Hyphomicrobiales bacterium]|nr:ABC transporter permease [Hyphomicrobiales bacterium]